MDVAEQAEQVRTVVVAVTPGEACAASLEYAAAEAQRRGARLRLVSAVPPVWGGHMADDFRVIDGELRRAGAHFLVECERTVNELTDVSVSLSTEVTHGTAVVAALTRASVDAELLVLQHHRMGHPHHLPTYSVTNGLAARGPAAVVAVPDDWRAAEEHPPVVVVGVEDAVSSARVALAAFEEARRRGATLRLVRAWFFSPAFEQELVYGYAGLTGEHNATVREEIEHDFAPLVAAFPDVTCVLAAVHGQPVDVLVGESRTASLLVVGRHEPVFPTGSHLGPVTRAVLAHAECPVLVLDPHGDREDSRAARAAARVGESTVPGRAL